MALVVIFLVDANIEDFCVNVCSQLSICEGLERVGRQTQGIEGRLALHTDP